MADGQQSGFDVNAARQAGYSDDEILQHLTQSRKFDVNSALNSGYSKPDVINYLATTKPAQQGTTSGSEQKSLGQRINDWWTTPTQTVAPGNVPGVEQDIPGATNSPQQSFRRGSAILAAEGAPALVTSAIAAPLATGLGLGGAAVGGYAGSKGGRWAGEKFGAPELGEDVGGLAGSFFGGMGSSKIGASATEASLFPRVLRSEAGTGPIRPAIRLLSPERAKVLEEFVPKRTVPVFPGAPLPDADQFYEESGKAFDAARRQEAIVKRNATAPRATPAKPIPSGTNYGQFLENQDATAKAQNESLGYQPGLTKVPIRPEPDYPLTPQSVPGPDTSGKGNLLTPLARKGDPRAAQELLRRGRGVLFVPAEQYPGTRLSGNLNDRLQGNPTPFGNGQDDYEFMEYPERYNALRSREKNIGGKK